MALATIPKANTLSVAAKRPGGEDPMVWGMQRALVVAMKAPQPTPGRVTSESNPHRAKPQPEPVSWHRASLPQIGRREAVRDQVEWRPGESAKRGYEKAVEDWWWL